MCKLALALACFLCMGHGRRARTTANVRSALQVVNPVVGSQALGKGFGKVQHNITSKDSFGTLRRLLSLLMSCSTASASFCIQSPGNCALSLREGHHCRQHSLVMESEQLQRWQELDADSERQRDATLLQRQELQREERRKIRRAQVLNSLTRVVLPTLLVAFCGYFFFDELSLFIRRSFEEEDFQFMTKEDDQFTQNFLNLDALLFGLLSGDAYSALYAQQKSIYFALYQEVSEAKSLLEQTTLVCQNRPFYMDALSCFRNYVENDLQRLNVTPAEILSLSPSQDPLESIMYMTSVGVPSVVYDTVRSLRQARGERLAAMQRKYPILGIILLYTLGFTLLLAFPILGAAISSSPDNVLNYQAFLFAILTGAVELVLRLILELWRTQGGVFNVDAVLQQMVYGLLEELESREKQALLLNPAAAATTRTFGREEVGER